MRGNLKSNHLVLPLFFCGFNNMQAWKSGRIRFWSVLKIRHLSWPCRIYPGFLWYFMIRFSCFLRNSDSSCVQENTSWSTQSCPELWRIRTIEPHVRACKSTHFSTLSAFFLNPPLWTTIFSTHKYFVYFCGQIMKHTIWLWESRFKPMNIICFYTCMNEPWIVGFHRSFFHKNNSWNYRLFALEIQNHRSIIVLTGRGRGALRNLCSAECDIGTCQKSVPENMPML